MALLLNPLKWLYKEFGLKSLQETGWDAWLIILSRSTRMLAYGAQSLLLAVFFSALKFSDSHIGLFFSLTLLGDVLLSVLLTLVADRVGRRRILFAGSFLMVLSGVVFARAENFWVLLFAAVVGVISATGSDFGVRTSNIYLVSTSINSDFLASLQTCLNDICQLLTYKNSRSEPSRNQHFHISLPQIRVQTYWHGTSPVAHPLGLNCPAGSWMFCSVAMAGQMLTLTTLFSGYIQAWVYSTCSLLYCSVPSARSRKRSKQKSPRFY
jgi:hypothetical protein